jgi:plastocyanin
MKAMKFLIILSSVLLIVGVSHAGSIKGKVTYDGKAPARQALTATKDQHCVDAVKGTKSESLVISKAGGVKNVVIYLRSRKAEATPPAKNPVMDQVGCAYYPHVLAVVAGTAVDVNSSDPVAHNVHSHAKKNKAVNWQIPKPGKPLPLKLTDAESIQFTCDIHNWMTGYIVVVENDHYGVTGYKGKDGKWISSDDYEKSSDAGMYTIKDVPEGTYRVQAWHEELGIATGKAVVPASGDIEINFSSKDFKKR